MTIRNFRPAAAAAVAACFSLVASPALATPSAVTFPHSMPVTTLPGDIAHDHGGWGGWRRHHGDGVDAGDIFAGLLIIGAVAAVASAASNASKEKNADAERYRDAPPPPPPPQASHYGDDPASHESQSDRGHGDWGRSRSIDAAVDTCVGEVERGSARVDTVDGVDRDGEGWRVAGKTRSGDPWQCAVDGDGRVRSLTVSGQAPYRN